MSVLFESKEFLLDMEGVKHSNPTFSHELNIYLNARPEIQNALDHRLDIKYIYLYIRDTIWSFVYTSVLEI